MLNRRKFIKSIPISVLGLTYASTQSACAKKQNKSSSPAVINSTPEIQESSDSYYCPVLPKAEFTSTTQDTKMKFETNSIPSHFTGLFPNPGCPMAIGVIKKTFFIDLNPTIATTITPLNSWLFGIAVSGAVFDPTGPFWSETITGPDTWEFEVMSANGRPYLGLDSSCAHVQPGGEYHYHGLPYDLIAQLERKVAGSRMLLLGYAADGFPIYSNITHSDPTNSNSSLRKVKSSYRLIEGIRPDRGPKGIYDGTFVQDYEYVASLGDLDECNGHFGTTPEYPNGIYHYHITEDFPFVPRYYRGTPDQSFAHRSPGPYPNALPPALLKVGR